MSDKILTISVAGYNVQDTLRECLDSCIVEEVLDDIEVIVVDDGSKDSTPDIAREYVEKWPGTFRLISKPNGGYGSTVNASIKAASGTYYRLLDGDDWLDAAGLRALVDALRVNDVDLVFTERVKETPNGQVYDERDAAVRSKLEGETITDDADLALLVPSMWMFTVRKGMYDEHPFELPEHCLYTDGLFTAHFLPYIKTAVYLPNTLYHYRFAYSDGQSVSRVSKKNHLRDYEIVWDEVKAIAQNECDGPLTPWMVTKLAKAYINLYIALMLQDSSPQYKAQVVALEKDLKAAYPAVYAETSKLSKSLRVLRTSRYTAYKVLSDRNYRVDA